MKGDTEVVLMIGFFIVGAALMAFAKDISMIPHVEAMLGAAATLIAAFVGAWYAFKLQLAHLEQRKTKEQVEAGNKAIFELVRTYNKFYAIKNQFIEEFRRNPARHVFIMPMAGDIKPLQLNFDTLAFLFDSEDPNLLGRLAMFEQEVASTLGVIDQRSRLHADIVQPTVEKLERESGPLMSIEQIEKALGTRYSKTLKMLTDFMVDGVDGVVQAAEHHIGEMNRILRVKFPGHKVIGMVKPNQSMQPAPENNGTADA